MTAPSPLYLIDGNNLAFVPGRDRVVSTTQLLAVRDRLLNERDARVLIYTDACFRGRARKAGIRAEYERLRRDGTIFQTPAEADPYLLAQARDHGGVVVSNDCFKDHGALRHGVPLRKVHIDPLGPVLAPDIVVYRPSGAERTSVDAGFAANDPHDPGARDVLIAALRAELVGGALSHAKLYQRLAARLPDFVDRLAEAQAGKRKGRLRRFLLSVDAVEVVGEHNAATVSWVGA